MAEEETECVPGIEFAGNREMGTEKRGPDTEAGMQERRCIQWCIDSCALNRNTCSSHACYLL